MTVTFTYAFNAEDVDLEPAEDVAGVLSDDGTSVSATWVHLYPATPGSFKLKVGLACTTDATSGSLLPLTGTTVTVTDVSIVSGQPQLTFLATTGFQPANHDGVNVGGTLFQTVQSTGSLQVSTGFVSINIPGAGMNGRPRYRTVGFD